MAKKKKSKKPDASILDNMSPAQFRALQYLLAGNTYAFTAKRMKLHANTIANWAKSESFQKVFKAVNAWKFENILNGIEVPEPEGPIDIDRPKTTRVRRYLEPGEKLPSIFTPEEQARFERMEKEANEAHTRHKEILAKSGYSSPFTSKTQASKQIQPEIHTASETGYSKPCHDLNPLREMLRDKLPTADQIKKSDKSKAEKAELLKALEVAQGVANGDPLELNNCST